MTFRSTFRVLAGGLLATATALLLACGGGDAGPVMGVDAAGNSSFDAQRLDATLASYPLSPISEQEAQGLATMREEEQLAHDVYAASAARWNLPIFGNIAASESTHTAAVKALLDRYGLADPLAGLPAGRFGTPALQDLHDTLVAASAASLVDALKIGVQIEELDLRDIAGFAATVDNADILLVYDNLQRGSRNHLRAFMVQLQAQGGSTVPLYLDAATFNAIVDSPMETGP